MGMSFEVAATRGLQRCCRRLAAIPDMGDSVIDFLLSAKCLVFVGYSLTDEDFVHIYDLVRQRLADTPRRPRIVTLDERIRGDTHPDAKVILTSGDRFLARIERVRRRARHARRRSL